MQIVINAGGVGTRLWPISTKDLPKQFCKLIGEKSLLQLAFERVQNLVAKENIWVSCNQKHLELVKSQLPNLLPENILTEPSRRDTFAAVLAHSSLIASKTSTEENIVFLGSDHYIGPKSSVQKFCDGLNFIEQNLNNNQFELLVAGVKPTFASTQYGYIKIDNQDKQKSFQTAVKVLSFKEKPNFEVASSFFEAGNYFWNMGLFAFKYSSLLNILKNHHLKLVEIVEKIRVQGSISSELYEQIPVEAFDYGVLEKTDNLGMIGMDLTTWEDIGNFEIYAKYLEEVPNLEQQIDKDFNQIQISGQNNHISLRDKTKKVAFVGVSDLVVVETEEGMIIINPAKGSEVKKVAGYFEE